MEDDGHSSTNTGFESLFIQEEDGQQERARVNERLEFDNLAQSGIPHMETLSSPQAQIHPYLREMDELLKSCEDLTGVSLGSRFSPSYAGTCLSDAQLKELNDGYGETSTSPQMSLSATYIDTRVEVSDTEGQLTQAYHDASSIMNTSCETTVDPLPTDISLTSAGTALSDTMTEYQSQLMGMLTMLENCMEESGIDLGSGMDFDTQECFALDTNHEYIQISSQRCDEYTAVENRMAAEMATLKSWGGHNAEPGITEGQYSSVIPGKPIVKHVEMESTSVQRQEQSETVMSETSVQEPRLSLSSPKIPRVTEAQNGSPNSEDTRIQNICGGKGSPTRLHMGEIILSDGEGPVMSTPVGMDMTHQRCSTEELATIRCQMEKYIEEVESLQRLRTALLEEVLGLRRKSEEQGDVEGKTTEREERSEPEETIDRKAVALLEELKKEEEKRREESQRNVLALREQRAEEERSVWNMNLERQGLQVQTWRLKRKLFTEARNCAHSLAALTNQQHAVERFKIDEETLQSLVRQLTEECSRLRSAQQERLSTLQVKLQAQNSRQIYSTVDELTECRRHSCGDIQRYLQGGLKALEERYEPMLMTLLKRRETTDSALRKAREQVQELRGQLRPLTEEGHRLGVQKVCLEERFKLMQMQRQEDIKQYKDIVLSLEESSWEMQTELKIQKRKTKETQEIKDNLANKLLLYRAAVEDQKKTQNNL